MKRRVFSFFLALLMIALVSVPALASEEDFFETAWEMALVLKNAVGVSFYTELEMEWSDPAWSQLGVTPGMTMEVMTANFSDGYKSMVCEYAFDMAEGEWDQQGVLVIPDNGVYFAQESSYADTEEGYLHYADGESQAICDVSRAYLYFAALGDNTMNAQLAEGSGGNSASYLASGDGLRLLMEMCFPQAVLGYADALDWENISAAVRVKVDPYGDNTYIVLESSDLGAALFAQVPGMERVQNVKLDMEIDIEAILAGMESEHEDVYDEMRPDLSELGHFTEAVGPVRQVQPLVEYIRSAYGRLMGGAAAGMSRDDAKNAIRDELAGLGG